MAQTISKKESENTVLDANKFFSFEEARVQELTLDKLRRTSLEHDVAGKPLMGIYHANLVEEILGMAREEGLTPEVFDMFAANNKDRRQPGVVVLPEMEAKYGERAIEAHVLRRVFTNVRLRDFDTDEYTTNLSIAFHQQGIQVGFGNNVIICHNQCMLGADRYTATYGKGRGENPTVQDVLGIVREWFKNAKDIVNNDRKKIKKMKSIVLAPEQIYTMIGMLTTMRVAAETSHKEIRCTQTIPLNQAQIGQLTERLMLQQVRDNKITLWDFYNNATELYKADRMDVSAILPQNLAMVKFLEEQYEIA